MKKNNCVLLLLCFIIISCSKDFDETETSQNIVDIELKFNEDSMASFISPPPPKPPGLISKKQDYILHPTEMHSHISSSTGEYLLSIDWSKDSISSPDVQIEIKDINHFVVESVVTQNDGKHSFSKKKYNDGTYTITIINLDGTENFDFREVTLTKNLIKDSLSNPNIELSNLSTNSGEYTIGISWNDQLIIDADIYIEIVNIDTAEVVESINVLNKGGSYTFSPRFYNDGTYKLSVTATNAIDSLIFTTKKG